VVCVCVLYMSVCQELRWGGGVSCVARVCMPRAKLGCVVVLSLPLLQALRAIGEGATAATNQNLWIRQRYGKLYENFRPEVTWWRLLLIFRKFLLAWATIMFNGNAMFQVGVVACSGCEVWVRCGLFRGW
jgi:hypothetical protein